MEETLFDKRVQAIQIAQGLLTYEALQKFLKGLPDETKNAKTLSWESLALVEKEKGLRHPAEETTLETETPSGSGSKLTFSV